MSGMGIVLLCHARRVYIANTMSTVVGYLFILYVVISACKMIEPPVEVAYIMY